MTGGKGFLKGVLMIRNFSIDETVLRYEEDLDDVLRISSSPTSYSVFFSKNNFTTTFKKIYNDGDIILIDANVLDLYPISNVDYFSVDAFEKNKSIKTVLKFVKYLSDSNFNKKNKVIVIGGGITQDIGAFASSIYKRGVSWVFFPTTLLSMCDSCIGGKTGINYLNGKNQLGLFSKPKKVIICYDFLRTLTDKDLKSGLGEILKLYSLIGYDYLKFYNDCVDNGKVKSAKHYPMLIKRALNIKKVVIEEDEYETNIRRSLNYGHTLGHAVEVMSGYNIAHGQAVAAGILMVNKLFGFSDNLYDRLCLDLIDKELLKNLKLSELELLIRKDKKTIGNKAYFVVLDEFGKISFAPKEINNELIFQIKNIVGML